MINKSRLLSKSVKVGGAAFFIVFVILLNI